MQDDDTGKRCGFQRNRASGAEDRVRVRARDDGGGTRRVGHGHQEGARQGEVRQQGQEGNGDKDDARRGGIHPDAVRRPRGRRQDGAGLSAGRGDGDRRRRPLQRNAAGPDSRLVLRRGVPGSGAGG